MEEQLNQLIEYTRQCLNQGARAADIRNQLVQNGWATTIIDEAFGHLRLPVSPTPLSVVQGQYTSPSNAAVQQLEPKPHQVRNGVLWILSPFIVLIGAAVLNLLTRLVGIHNSPIINILVILAGMAGVILIPVGFIRGIIKLVGH